LSMADHDRPPKGLQITGIVICHRQLSVE